MLGMKKVLRKKNKKRRGGKKSFKLSTILSSIRRQLSLCEPLYRFIFYFSSKVLNRLYSQWDSCTVHFKMLWEMLSVRSLIGWNGCMVDLSLLSGCLYWVIVE